MTGLGKGIALLLCVSSWCAAHDETSTNSRKHSPPVHCCLAVAAYIIINIYYPLCLRCRLRGLAVLSRRY